MRRAAADRDDVQGRGVGADRRQRVRERAPLVNRDDGLRRELPGPSCGHEATADLEGDRSTEQEPTCLGAEDEIVVTDQEHFGLAGPVHVSGARVVVTEGSEEAILAAVTPRTRLIATSHVLWTNGRRLDLARIRSLAVDVIAGIGVALLSLALVSWVPRLLGRSRDEVEAIADML